MMNPAYHISRMRALLEEYKPSRERSLAVTKLDEMELWLTKCEPTDEALARDQREPLPGDGTSVFEQMGGTITNPGDPA
jgi:hypothetical protein